MGRIPKYERVRNSALPSVDVPPSSGDGKPTIKFEFADPGKYCLHDWTADQLRALVKFFQYLEQHTWVQVTLSGGKDGKGKKHGLGYTRLDRDDLPNFPSNVSKDAAIFELRVDREKRVVGFRSGTSFNVVWFDAEHGVCPMG